MPDVLLDTAVLIDQLRQPKPDTIWKRLPDQKSHPTISAITIAELWAGESIERTKEKSAAGQLLKQAQVLPLTTQILKQAGVLLRSYQHLVLADALVASTAMTHHLPLASLNQKHFKPLKGLTLLDI